MSATPEQAAALRARLDHEHRCYLAWCAMRALDPVANGGEGHWEAFWADRPKED